MESFLKSLDDQITRLQWENGFLKDQHNRDTVLLQGALATQKATQQPAPEIPDRRSPLTIEKVKTALALSKDREDLLSFTIKDDVILVKPKQYIGDDFAKIASIVRGLGGEYISAGKDSHFRIQMKSQHKEGE